MKILGVLPSDGRLEHPLFSEGSWNSLPIALRLSLVLVQNMPGRSLLHAEDVSLSAPVVPAAREQPVQQHPAELGWSAAFESSVVASVALLQRDHLDGLDHPCWCCLAFAVVCSVFLTLLAPGW
ncbi:hypothetical protein DY000_02059327 [Brassica cretica]|uniref:Uncharacterized protein n=1 Tax=Brassica cretica TaxID=69181 RepID=A0ABQ7B2N4_BRACR|nr:hypothetical protein DY000_02059327 [Brassica cretica]